MVRSSVLQTLSAGVETLILTGSALSGTGNSLDNQITGNMSANTLNGGTGADTMTGGAGGDLYRVDNAGDVVREVSSGGNDTVQASVSEVLDANVESLVLVGSGDIDGTGNSLANVITGNGGTNELDGKAGLDTISGGAGADQFLFTSALNPASNVDTILNYGIAGDTIVLDHSVFTALSPGTLPSETFVRGAAAQDADDCIIYDTSTGALFYDSDGTGANAAKQFAQLASNLPFTAAEFVII